MSFIVSFIVSANLKSSPKILDKLKILHMFGMLFERMLKVREIVKVMGILMTVVFDHTITKILDMNQLKILHIGGCLNEC